MHGWNKAALIKLILFYLFAKVDPREKEREAVMEGYVLEQDGKKWNRCWYMLGKDLALYKFKAHEVQ